VLDARGVVTAKFFEEDYRVRDAGASILLRKFGLQPVDPHEVSAKHAVLTAWASGNELRAGQRVTLGVEWSCRAACTSMRRARGATFPWRSA
jgi:hypothetical protein